MPERFTARDRGRNRPGAIAAVLLAVGGCADDADQPDASSCPTSEIEPGTDFPETRGEGDEAWALLWNQSPWKVGQDVKVVWRMAGTGSFEVRAIGPDGEIVGPSSPPMSHGGSNWNRPGAEWGTFFKLPSEGCWRLEARRSDAVSTVTISVVEA